MKTFLLGAIILAGITSSSYGVCYNEGCTGKINKLYITKGNKVYIGTDGDESKINCTSPAGVYVTIPNAGTAAAKTMFSTILTAQTTQSAIELRTVDGSAECEVAYVVLQK